MTAHFTITNKETNEQIATFFNPKEYSIKKSNSFAAPKTPGKLAYPPQFTGSQPQTMSFALVLDADMYGLKDIRREADALLALMELVKADAPKNKARPPILEVRWGQTFHFDAVLTSLTIQYTLFNADGDPLRANVTCDLQQVGKPTIKGGGGGTKRPTKGQNPTTVGTAGLRSHVVRDGDSLASLAYRYLDDPTRWRQIAEANGIDDPLRLRRGAVLAIPRDE
jgi:hypothetical protein